MGAIQGRISCQVLDVTNGVSVWGRGSNHEIAGRCSKQERPRGEDQIDRTAQPGRTSLEQTARSSACRGAGAGKTDATARVGRAGKWPSYRYCIDDEPKARGGEHPDISRADFTWCVTAIDWGHSIDHVSSQLMEESAMARANGQQCGLITAANAVASVQRRVLVQIYHISPCAERAIKRASEWNHYRLKLLWQATFHQSHPIAVGIRPSAEAAVCNKAA
jgi:hypothetical protein